MGYTVQAPAYNRRVFGTECTEGVGGSQTYLYLPGFAQSQAWACSQRKTFPPPDNPPTGCYTFTDHQCLRPGHIARPDGPTPVFLGHYFSTGGSHTSWRIPELHPHVLNLDFQGLEPGSHSVGPVRFITTAAINHGFLCVVMG